jgi:hypothetical protein
MNDGEFAGPSGCAIAIVEGGGEDDDGRAAKGISASPIRRL